MSIWGPLGLCDPVMAGLSSLPDVKVDYLHMVFDKKTEGEILSNHSDKEIEYIQDYVHTALIVHDCLVEAGKLKEEVIQPGGATEADTATKLLGGTLGIIGGGRVAATAVIAAHLGLVGALPIVGAAAASAVIGYKLSDMASKYFRKVTGKYDADAKDAVDWLIEETKDQENQKIIPQKVKDYVSDVIKEYQKAYQFDNKHSDVIQHIQQIRDKLSDNEPTGLKVKYS